MSTAASIAIALIFTWCGFICAISFMESWLKFRTPGLTRPVGLGIGKLIFSALNKIERILTLILMFLLFLIPGSIYSAINGLFLLVIFIILIQTFLLLPALNKRAEKIMEGQTLPPSKLHYWYIGGEFVKLTTLIFSGISLLNQS